MMQAINFSFEAQGRYGFFSGGGKAEFAENTRFNSTSTFLVARCLVKNPLKRGKNFVLKQSAQQLIDALRFDEFTLAFGDSFVRGLQTGGEFYAVVRMTSVSQSTQASLAATLQAEANGLLASGSFKSSFNTFNASDQTRSEFNVTMFQNAGIGAQSAPVAAIDEVIARFKKFPEIANEHPAAYETEVATYNTLPLPLPTPEQQEAFIFALRDTRERKLRFIQVKNDLEFVLQHPEFFRNVASPETMMSAISTYTKLINAVVDHAIKLSNGQISPPRIFDPGMLVPPLAEPAPIPIVKADAVGPPTPRTVYRRGDRGPGVLKLQERLRELGIRVEMPGFPRTEVTATGQFLALTAAAVATFQVSRGLFPDGEVGPVTMPALGLALPSAEESNAGLPPPALGRRLSPLVARLRVGGVLTFVTVRTFYQLGDRGPAVSELRSALSAQGFTSDPDPAATFGSATDVAVRAFQANRGLLQDGEVGRGTLGALGLTLPLPADEGLLFR
ncbi:peptidoglycan-binding domain-containing protein [Plastoroseomonas arctica]|uniref:Peptidoglycan-binding protein n=1 Tax=Plastoroseomonas arctica TaxID=1509237 RepID=A0AAF1JX17_9PROT|nr:peptidoglycan-binding protein [Plastoroseomonas arctica]MBR0655792.1 peptidoglycan-binding protein [Plastoroseomonas arctica]